MDTMAFIIALTEMGVITEGIADAVAEYLEEHPEVLENAMAIIGAPEASSTAASAHVPGTDSEYFIYDGKLRKATGTIAQGGSIVTSGSGQNCEEVTVGGELGKTNGEVSELKSAINDQAFLSGLLNSGVGENGFFKYNLRYYPKGTGTIVTGGNYYTSPYVNIKSLGAEISYEIPSSPSVNILTIFNSSFEYIGYSDTILTREQILTSYPTAEWVRYSCFNTDLSSLSITPIWNGEIINVNGLVTINARDILSTGKVTNALFNNKFAELFSEKGYYSVGTGTYNASGNYHTTPFILISEVMDIDISYNHPSGSSANKVTLLNASGSYLGYTNGTISIASLLETYPTAKYIRFSCADSQITTLTVTTNIDKRISNLDAIHNNSVNIFTRVGCIGDSYTSGYIKLTPEGLPNNTYPVYSWVEQMQGLTGRVWTNFGKGGSSTKSWMNGGGRLDEVQEIGNKCQAYIIGLGINDISNAATKVSLGTSADIGTDADSYYAYYYKLVKAVYAVNNDAKIFCLTLPQPSVSVSVPGYNQAVRDIVTYCRTEGLNVFLCDLADTYYTSVLFANEIYTTDKIQGHYTAIGYNFMAQCLQYALSDVINNNISDFQDVFMIDYDEPT